MKGQKQKKGIIRAILAALSACLMAVAAYSGWKLYRYYAQYAEDRNHYQDLREAVVSGRTQAAPEADTSPGTQRAGERAVSGTGTQEESRPGGEVQEAPLVVDWEALLQVNEEIIGWVYFTGLPQISYPVLQAEDNAYYVHRTFDLSSDTSKAGSIFMDFRMEGDFSSPYTVIYGHNVRDGSMFSDLALLKDQALYDEEPYFWILTPQGDYLYQVFSIFRCHRSADVFQKCFDGWGEEFAAWEQELKSRNTMQGDVTLSGDGHVIAFSTCVPDSFDRTIVCGRCISKEQPPFGGRKEKEEGSLCP